MLKPTLCSLAHASITAVSTGSIHTHYSGKYWYFLKISYKQNVCVYCMYLSFPSTSGGMYSGCSELKLLGNNNYWRTDPGAGLWGYSGGGTPIPILWRRSRLHFPPLTGVKGSSLHLAYDLASSVNSIHQQYQENIQLPTTEILSKVFIYIYIHTLYKQWAERTLAISIPLTND